MKLGKQLTDAPLVVSADSCQHRREAMDQSPQVVAAGACGLADTRLLLAITTISAFVHVGSDSQVEAEGMPRLLAEAAALPPSFNRAAKLSRDRSTHRALDADHRSFSSSLVGGIASPSGSEIPPHRPHQRGHRTGGHI